MKSSLFHTHSLLSHSYKIHLFLTTSFKLSRFLIYIHSLGVVFLIILIISLFHFHSRMRKNIFVFLLLFLFQTLRHIFTDLISFFCATVVPFSTLTFILWFNHPTSIHISTDQTMIIFSLLISHPLTFPYHTFFYQYF